MYSHDSLRRFFTSAMELVVAAAIAVFVILSLWRMTETRSQNYANASDGIITGKQIVSTGGLFTPKGTEWRIYIGYENIDFFGKAQICRKYFSVPEDVYLFYQLENQFDSQNYREPMKSQNA